MTAPAKNRIEKEEMIHTRQNSITIVLTLVIAVMQVFIAPALWRLSDSVSELKIKAARTESFIENFALEGPRYTERDAEKDFGVMSRVIADLDADVQINRAGIESLQKRVRELELNRTKD